jgi:predicted HicB family RNase H-like nuclease
MSEPVKTTNIRIPHDIWYAAKIKGLDTDESLNAMIVRLLTEYLK